MSSHSASASQSFREWGAEALALTACYTALMLGYARWYPELPAAAHAALLLAMAVLLTLLVVRHGRPGWRTPNGAAPVEILIGLLAVAPIMAVTILWLALDLPIPQRAAMQGQPPYLLALCLVLYFAVFEETLFRGLILARLEDEKGKWIALIGSSVLFGAAHAVGRWSAAALGYYSVLGAFLGVLFIWRRGLIAPLACHIGLNLFWLGIP